MESHTSSIEDIFDSSLTLEDSHIQEGYDEGYSHGLVTGKEEGREVGLRVGFETGEELGFYKGCVDVWNSAFQVEPTRFSNRAIKGVKTMEKLIEKYPIFDPENESVGDMMDSLRLKFKEVCANLGVKNIEYKGYPKMTEGKGVEF